MLLRNVLLLRYAFGRTAWPFQVVPNENTKTTYRRGWPSFRVFCCCIDMVSSEEIDSYWSVKWTKSKSEKRTDIRYDDENRNYEILE